MFFFINGSGFLFYIEEEKLILDSFKFKNIETNLNQLIKNKLITEAEHVNFGWESIKDLLILDDKIFISYVEEQELNCTNIQVLMGEVNLEYIEFRKIFEPQECISRYSEKIRSLWGGR